MSVLKPRLASKITLFALFIGALVIVSTWSPVQAINIVDEAEVTSIKDELSPAKNNEALCYFFTETGSGQGGFAVTDEGWVTFASAFQKWGLTKIGYPISHRYERDGFVTQAFQKAIMQWRPDTNSVALVNIFDDLYNAGYDETLLATRQVPLQFPPGWDGDISFDKVIQKRQAVLQNHPALSKVYFGSENPLTFFGLPASEVTDMGNHKAVRLQRAVLQEWKEDVPWAKKGEVTIANGGDITKELGALSGEVIVPIQNGPCPRTTSAPTGEPPKSPAPVKEEPATPAEKATAVPEEKATTVPEEKATAISEEKATAVPEEKATAVPEEKTPTPPASATPVPPPAAKACSADLALVQFDSGLGEALTIRLNGPNQGSFTIPANGSVNRCLERGTYQFSTESNAIRSISGEKALVSEGCECWKLFFLFPWTEPCTCSANPNDYTPLQP